MFTWVIRICALTEVGINIPFAPSVLRHSSRKKAGLLWAGYSVLVQDNIPFFSVVLVTDGPDIRQTTDLIS